MSQCPTFGDDGPSGVAEALRQGRLPRERRDRRVVRRLFGAHGSFQTALTIILTLYIACSPSTC